MLKEFIKLSFTGGFFKNDPYDRGIIDNNKKIKEEINI